MSVKTKPELGVKRLCAGCNARFYDLARDPITCPTCKTIFLPPPPPPPRPTRAFRTPDTFAPVPVEPVQAGSADDLPEADDEDEVGVLAADEDEDEKDAAPDPLS
ncbi:MAG: hypothetical protein JWN93_201 [Hyphomicrobiales bacterium]|nr:hypothetical protein [Hyphomicrobiales bacterium]